MQSVVIINIKDAISYSLDEYSSISTSFRRLLSQEF